jgi:hypothetical protein
MSDIDLLTRYNYEAFVPEKFEPWMRFDKSPPLGEPAPDFSLTDLDGTTTRLSDIWSAHVFTIVEFGSFT